jgi:hypothetical protein
MVDTVTALAPNSMTMIVVNQDAWLVRLIAEVERRSDRFSSDIRWIQH